MLQPLLLLSLPVHQLHQLIQPCASAHQLHVGEVLHVAFYPSESANAMLARFTRSIWLQTAMPSLEVVCLGWHRWRVELRLHQVCSLLDEYLIAILVCLIGMEGAFDSQLVGITWPGRLRVGIYVDVWCVSVDLGALQDVRVQGHRGIRGRSSIRLSNGIPSTTTWEALLSCQRWTLHTDELALRHQVAVYLHLSFRLHLYKLYKLIFI